MRKVLLVATAAAAISCAQGAMADTITFSGTYTVSNDAGTGWFAGSFTLNPADGTDFFGLPAWVISAGSLSATGAITTTFTPIVDYLYASQFSQWSDGAGGVFEQLQLTDGSGATFAIQVDVPNDPDPATYAALVGTFTGDSIANASGYNSGGTAFSIDSVTLRSAAVPEPASILVLSAGLAGLAALRRKRPAG